MFFFLSHWNRNRNQQKNENWKIHKYVKIKQHILKIPVGQKKKHAKSDGMK